MKSNYCLERNTYPLKANLKGKFSNYVAVFFITKSTTISREKNPSDAFGFSILL